MLSDFSHSPPTTRWAVRCPYAQEGHRTAGPVMEMKTDPTMVNSIKDGETYNSIELANVLGFKGRHAHDSCKKWIVRMNIPKLPCNGIWWMAGEDIRRAMRMGPPDDEELDPAA